MKDEGEMKFPPAQEAKLQEIEKLADRAAELRRRLESANLTHRMDDGKCNDCGISLAEATSEVCKVRMEREKLHDRADNDFTFHPVKPGQGAKYTQNRDWAREMAHKLIDQCPPSRELSVALTKLDEVVYWANAAIARNTKS